MSIVHRAGALPTLLLTCALVSPAATQEPVEAAAAPDPEVAEAAAPAADSAVEDPSAYARIEQSDTPLRCFPTSYSPVYDEKLGEGDVVVPVGEAQNGYRSVRLPLGVVGYVHARFAEVGEDGTVSSKGSRVAFRYRPNSREAPVRFVDDGTAFQLVAVDDGEWLRVRFPEQTAWVPETSLVVFPADEAADTVVAAWKSHVERQRAQIAEAAAELERRREEAARLAELREKTAATWEQLRAETQKPNAEQDLEPLRTEAAALVAEIPEDTPERAEADRLLAAVEQQARALEMRRLIEEERPTPRVTVEPRIAEEDPLGDYATGWLRVSGGLFSARRVTLEKGGQVLFDLGCSTGRYTLDIFEGMEVAVRGPADRPDAESLRRLDVQRIEVLARPRH